MLISALFIESHSRTGEKQTLLTSSIIPLTFLCWQNTMSFKCLILSRRSPASSCSSLDLNTSSDRLVPQTGWSQDREGLFLSDASQIRSWRTSGGKKELQRPDASAASYNGSLLLTSKIIVWPNNLNVKMKSLIYNNTTSEQTSPTDWQPTNDTTY